MKFHFTKDPSPGIAAQSARISQLLNEGKNVLWLLAGGSNIPIAAEILTKIRGTVAPERMSFLALALTDERYGPVGHNDSNWHQLTSIVPDLTDIQSFSILRDMPLEKTVVEYAKIIDQLFQAADVIVAQFGMGADGHIAGMLPHCPALESTHMVHGYVAEPFTRITLTMPALKQIDIAYAFIFGISKGEALWRLYKENVPLEEQPAQILKQLPEADVYQDVVS